MLSACAMRIGKSGGHSGCTLVDTCLHRLHTIHIACILDVRTRAARTCARMLGRPREAAAAEASRSGSLASGPKYIYIYIYIYIYFMCIYIYIYSVI